MTAPPPDFDLFLAHVEEWVSRRTIRRFYAECWSLFTHHYTPQQVAAFIREKSKTLRCP